MLNCFSSQCCTSHNTSSTRCQQHNYLMKEHYIQIFNDKIPQSRRIVPYPLPRSEGSNVWVGWWANVGGDSSSPENIRHDSSSKAQWPRMFAEKINLRAEILFLEQPEFKKRNVCQSVEREYLLEYLVLLLGKVPQTEISPNPFRFQSLTNLLGSESHSNVQVCIQVNLFKIRWHMCFSQNKN